MNGSGVPVALSPCAVIGTRITIPCSHSATSKTSSSQGEATTLVGVDRAGKTATAARVAWQISAVPP